ncbi:hypothetical protein [Sandaracinus amylolyticus]|uniref:hypothetical protein n=1 Tax=Sandaracinus amylolyticus TaxID=927083 RepID=UPI001F1CC86F|nr:hypothetical protein [Sandaracinus amylolyticus]UJR86633.1 Hypothetical protein I5071_87340 [Sandaracinus amylolyticus]
MKRLQPFAPFLLFAACALSQAGCVRTPQSICQEYVDAINAMFERCNVPFEFFVARPDGTRGCGAVQRVTDAHPILDECIPWADTVECSEVDPAAPASSFPASCSARVFQFVE